MTLYDRRHPGRARRRAATHPLLAPIPVVLLAGATVTDLAFWMTGASRLATASMWLIGAAVVVAALASVINLTDVLGSERGLDARHAWHHFAGNSIAVLLALADFYIRYFAGAQAAAVPAGLVLTLIAVGILLLTGLNDGELVERPWGGSHRRRANFRAAMRDDTAAAFDRRRPDRRRAA